MRMDSLANARGSDSTHIKAASPVQSVTRKTNITSRCSESFCQCSGSDAVNARRILLVSNARPSRTSRLARRIMREADAQICGIVQRPVQELPLAQQLLAYGCTMTEGTSASTPRFGLGAMRKRITDAALWWIHGAPNGVIHKKSR